MISIYNALGIPEGEEIQHKTISKTIEKAQKKIENNNFGIRKNLLDYDRVNNEQREVMYKERRRVLDGDDMKESVLGMMKETVANHVYQVISDELPPEEWDLAALNAELLPIVPLNKIVLTDAEKSSGKVDDLVARLQEETVALYEQKEKEFEDFDLREIERIILLKVIDRKWMDHIDDMDQLREGIGLQAYGQRDVYKRQIHSRREVQCFLQSAANYWLEEYHFDGIRMDAVSRLIYWQGDESRGVNDTAIDFLKAFNLGLKQRHPTAMLIAEDSTAYPLSLIHI